MDIASRLKDSRFDPFLSSKKVVKAISVEIARDSLGRLIAAIKEKKSGSNPSVLMEQIKEKLRRLRPERDRIEARLLNIFQKSNINYLGQLATLKDNEMFENGNPIDKNLADLIRKAVHRFGGGLIQGVVRDELKSQVGARPEGRGTGYLAQKFDKNEMEAIRLQELAYKVFCAHKVKERIVNRQPESRFFYVVLDKKIIAEHRADFVQKRLHQEGDINESLNKIPELRYALAKKFKFAHNALHTIPESGAGEVQEKSSRGHHVELTPEGLEAFKIYSPLTRTAIIAEMQRGLLDAVEDAIPRIPGPSQG
ncbi:MAG: hypothetical protein DHS20C02_08790 [Micavibrio sp.]|nr:MAG: hypothetical protein DHS20C02_08790 [Micavibrio sp.]